MRCFITGVTGFVGTHLVEHLLDRGFDVLGIGRTRREYAHFVQCDLLDFDRLAGVIGNFQPECVYHLAGLASVAGSKDRPRDYYVVNVQGTVNVLEALRQNGSQARVLLVSSAEIYGNPAEDAVDEQALPNPLNPYASSKMAGEEVARQYLMHYRSQIVIARPFNHSGPGQSTDFVVSDFCEQIARAELTADSAGNDSGKIGVGNLTPVRDFTDVRDVVDAYAGLAEKGGVGEAYNVCSGVGTPIEDILKLTLQYARAPIEVEVSPEKYRPAGNVRLVGSNQKLRTLLDWAPKFTLEQTIVDTLDYWREISHR